VIVGLLGVVVGTAILLGLKAPASGPHSVDVVAGAPLDPSSGVPSTSDSPRTTKAPRTATKAPPTTKAPPRTTASATRSILGDAVPARNFGNVQVRVVLTGNHIDDVVVVQMSNRPRNAPDRLRQEALAKQSANLSNVSGATYTAQAYMRSLQSALDRA
jgi:uncharacterized protein with FMN-binding domain